MSGPKSATPPRAVLSGHVVLALIAVVAVGVGAAAGNAPVAWAAAALVAGAGGLGIAALTRSLRRAREEGLARPSTGVLAVHGVAAGATFLLALAAAARLT